MKKSDWSSNFVMIRYTHLTEYCYVVTYMEKVLFGRENMGKTAPQNGELRKVFFEKVRAEPSEEQVQNSGIAFTQKLSVTHAIVSFRADHSDVHVLLQVG